MGFLNPAFLLAGSLVLIPIFLHFFYRQESKTFTFPAIRYLLRTERDHAKQIRTQQLLLLLLRIALLSLLVLLGSRIHFPGPGGAHEPTALALVLDNSLSTTLVENGERRLDALKEAARESALAAGHDDVLWVLPAGSPWATAAPGSAADAMAEVDRTPPSHGSGDLGAVLERAVALVSQSDLPAREVHVFTDLQATGFPRAQVGVPDVPVVVFGLPPTRSPNRGVSGVTIGGGLPPLADRRTEAVVDTYGPPGGDTVGVRLYVDGQVRAATQAPAGSTVRLPLGPFSTGRVEGFVEIDPDPLTADDRFYFTFNVREPTPVAYLGDANFFVDQALSVLEDDGRISLGGPGAAETLLSVGGQGLSARDRTQSVVAYPVSDPARLPALNRQLAEAGIPYRFEVQEGLGARITDARVGGGLEDLQISGYYRMVPTDGVGGTPVATLSNGDAWIVEGQTPLGPYVLFASPFDEEATSLPVSASMIPLLEWALDRWSAGGDQSADIVAGTPYIPPATAERVRLPTGEERAVDGDQPFRATGEIGLYAALRGDSVLDAAAANAPAGEGDLNRLDEAALRQSLPGLTGVVSDPDRWTSAIFRAGRGPEPWRPLLIAVLVLLAVEATVAASGRLRQRPSDGTLAPGP